MPPAAPGIPRGADVPAPFGQSGAPGQRPSGAIPATNRPPRPPSDPFAPPPAPPFPSSGSASFAAPGARASASAPPGARTPSIPSDPFAAAPLVAPAREVRLVIDDKAVDDAEVGRKSGLKLTIGLLVAAAVGVLIGWFVGSTSRERQLYDLVLQDAKDIYGSVATASATVEQAQRLIDQAVKSAAPAAGKGVEIDFKAIEELRKLEKPFPADVFSRKHYRAFEAATVDQLFQYYNNTNLLWAKIGIISAKALTPAAREGLTRAAKSAGDLAATDFGCVPFKDGNSFGCGLVSVVKDAGGKLMVNARGGSYEKQPYAGQDLGAKASDYVILVDKGRSNEVLAGSTSQFQSFARDLMEAKTLADQTVILQGQLTQQLGAIAKLKSLN